MLTLRGIDWLFLDSSKSFLFALTNIRKIVNVH